MRFRILVALFVLTPVLRAAAAEAFIAEIVAPRTLRITGTAAAETIVVRVVPGKKQLEVDYKRADGRGKAQRTSFPIGSIDRLEIDAGAGADFVNVIDPASTFDGKKKRIDLKGGDGDNIVAVTPAPFAPETATRMRSLLDVSRKIEQIARRAAGATAIVLQNDAMAQAERVRALSDEANAIAKQAEEEIFAPATELLEKQLPARVTAANGHISAAERSEKEHQQLVASLTKQLDPTNGNFPRDNDAEPDTEPAGTEPSFLANELRARARAEQAERAAMQVGSAAESQTARAEAELEQAAAAIAARIDALDERAERLAGTGDAAGVAAENELTASTLRVLTILDELRALAPALADAVRGVRDDIVKAAQTAAPVQEAMMSASQAGASCSTPSTTKTYTGGDDFDFFFPLSATSQGWSIDGGDGFNILFGGFAADDIKGGDDTDVVFGLKGNDRIQGGKGVDLLFGEFILDLASQTGQDCIRGEDGIDLLAGDNFLSDAAGTDGERDTLEGGADTDLLFGDDVLDFLSDTTPGGRDEISGHGGIDLLFGCGGDDVLSGQDDIDLVAGNGGDDIIKGNDGRNVTIGNTTIHLGNLLLGNRGDDTVTGGKGIDIIFGNPGRDTLEGDAQIDLMFGGAGPDVMRGAAGGVVFTIKGIDIRLGNLMLGGAEDDRMWGGGDLDVMLGQSGDDRVIGFDKTSYNVLGIDMDILHGGDGDDYLEGDDEYPLLALSNDFLFGRAGNDTMKGGSNRDFLFGGDGNDTMEGDSNALQLVLSLDLMIGGKGNDAMKGGNSIDIMLGRAGNDTMSGDDEAVGVLSHDLMFGGDDDDVMLGGSSIDLMFGGDGADRMTGDSNLAHQPLSSDFMFGGEGPDEMHGGNALDLMFGQRGCDRMFGDNGIQARLSPDLMFGGPDDDFMEGGVNPDFLFGGPGQDTMSGDPGEPWMFASIDFMFGGDGCDAMKGGRGTDFLWGGADVDTMDGQWAPDLLFGGDGGDTMNGGDSLDLLFGRGGNDTIHGDAGPDVVDGGDGDDCLYGDAGPDIVAGESGKDCVRGGEHPDILSGGAGDDRVFGDGGSDLLFGAENDDMLDGGSGADILSGGTGTDQLFGGPGPDLMFGEQKKQSASSGLDCDCKPERCEGTLCVRKFDDRNGNGKEDPGEAGLPKWEFGVVCGGCAASPLKLVTDAQGNACALVLPGTCKATETQQPGWTPTTDTVQEVTTHSSVRTTASFGNRRPPDGEVCIRKYHDLNGNGAHDPGEPLIAGWAFDITAAGTTTRVTTGANGSVCEALPSGTYGVTEIPKRGWTATTPATQQVAVTSGSASTVSFGNREQRIANRLCVFKFDDLNANGVRDAGEPPLPGWSFDVFASGATLTTDAGGSACTELAPGTTGVREQMQPGWTPTTALLRSTTITAGATTTELFGNHRNASHGTLCITKFRDDNRNGIRDGAEPGMPNWVFDISGRVSTPVFTDAAGTVCTPLDAGTYTIVERTRAGWAASTPVEQTAVVPAKQTVTLLFGNQITESTENELCILKFEDRNGDGVRNGDEPGLPGWEFRVTGNGRTITVTTEDTGRVCRTLPGTTYIIEEQPRPGWSATTPSKLTFTLRPSSIGGVQFGNRRVQP